MAQANPEKAWLRSRIEKAEARLKLHMQLQRDPLLAEIIGANEEKTKRTLEMERRLFKMYEQDRAMKA